MDHLTNSGSPGRPCGHLEFLVGPVKYIHVTTSGRSNEIRNNIVKTIPT